MTQRLSVFLGSVSAIMAAYLLLIAVGIIGFFIPSPALMKQGGTLVVVAWGACCIAGGATGVVALITRVPLMRLLGAQLSATASLTWTVSLILQATEQATAITAACMAGTLTLLFTQRCVDIYRRSRR